MYLIIWEYEVRPERVAEFERAYRGDGVWAEFFGADPAYLKTELFRSSERGNVYLTCDYWRSENAYVAFCERNANRYRDIDAQCDELTLSERRLGAYTLVE
ncbi:MAG TPA: antibiotic biosynthesis monooxygenase [candidate division Zixibacteria bacterium]|nr:antibiotic biosynthesis monooxygenase [candidate division Zixibacteria bacterium]